MKRKNALLFAVLGALGLAVLITMIAYLNSPAMDYDYIATPQGVIITGVDRVKGGVWEVPEEIDGIPVVQLGRTDLAYGKPLFEENSTQLTDLFIPANVKVIAREAFRGCIALERVRFAEDSPLTTLPLYAFDGCSALREVTLHAALTMIDSCAFQDCTALETVRLPEGSALTEIGQYAFSGCSALVELSLPSTVQKLGECAFNGCTALQRFAIPTDSMLKEIGRSCFAECHLAEISLPAGLEVIGARAFGECVGLTRVYMAKTDAWKYRVDSTDTAEGEPPATEMLEELLLATPEYAAQTLLNFKDELRRHRAFETAPPLNKGQNAREE